MFNLNYLELFILNTIIYFDLFDYPLTLNEIYEFLYTGGMEGSVFTLAEISECLSTSPKIKKIITTKRGFYFLQKREEIINTRLDRYNLANRKFKLANRAIRFFKYLPFIKLVAVCNNLANSNAQKESDIDFFIIVSQGRIWLVRFMAIISIALLGLRPPKEKAQDKICLSFFVTEDNLDLSQVKINTEDIYLVFWLATLMPVYEREDYYAKLVEANLWLKKYLPNWQPVTVGLRRRIEDDWFNFYCYQIKEFMWSSFLGVWLEGFIKKMQWDLMAQKKKDLAVLEDTKVIISDTMLKFHESDRRLEYLAKFESHRTRLLNKI